MTPSPGMPIWFELNTPDPDAAQRFYAGLAGWRFTVSPAPEHMGYRLGGPSEHEPVVGLMDSTAMDGGLPGWLLYLASDDVDADTATVRDLGGAVRFGPMDIPHVGRFAVVADPQGVVFALMKGTGEPSTAFAPMGGRQGHGAWIELATPDPDAAFAFYGALFGWTKAGAMPMGDMGEYAFIGTQSAQGERPEGQATGPGAVMSSAATGAPARWNWYVQVPDIDAAVATAFDGGGKVLQGPDPIPGGDYSANVADPQGQQIGLVGPRRGDA